MMAVLTRSNGGGAGGSGFHFWHHLWELCFGRLFCLIRVGFHEGSKWIFTTVLACLLYSRHREKRFRGHDLEAEMTGWEHKHENMSTKGKRLMLVDLMNAMCYDDYDYLFFLWWCCLDPM